MTDMAFQSIVAQFGKLLRPVLVVDLVARYKFVSGEWVPDEEASRHWYLDGREVNEDGTPLDCNTET